MNQADDQYSIEVQGTAGIMTLRQKIFNFSLNQTKKQEISNKKNKFVYKDSFYALKQQVIWKPKMPCKRIFQQPKFLLSLQRKKVRVINGLKSSEFQPNTIKRNIFKSARLRYKKQSNHKAQVVSEPYQISQNYTHTTLSLNLNDSHKTTKTSFHNFNLHHLIKQKKQGSLQKNEYPVKKGSNRPYYHRFSSQFAQKSRGLLTPNIEDQNKQYKKQIKTAQPIQKRRHKQSKSVVQQRNFRNQIQQIQQNK